MKGHHEDEYALDVIRNLQRQIPGIISGRDVSKMTAEELRNDLQPIKELLKSVDAERLLQLMRTAEGNGAPIGNG